MKTEEEHIADISKKEFEKVLLSKSELSIWLDRYEDIFSDFDPSPYSERILSDDFLHEVRKRTHEKDTGKIQLRLLLPENVRNKETEAVIIRHLHAHFKHETLLLAEHKKKMTRKGWLLTLCGLTVMTFAAWLIYISAQNFPISMLRVVTEPAGWFLVWTGLEQVFYTTQKINPDLYFYKRMNKAEISFWSY
jgi:hypothetical protein